MSRILALLLGCTAVPFLLCPQTPSPTLAEKLGYPHDAKLLIVHADDLGMTHSVNEASIRGLESGVVNSASMMVPCPWFPEIADYARNHPDADLGLHLTLTSERVYVRWSSVASKEKVPSLLDPFGYFFLDWTRNAHINPKEAEIEIRAQIERALAMGVRPTHLDSHQYRLIETNEELLHAALRAAHDYKLPLFIARDWFADHPYIEPSLSSSDIVLDHTVTIAPGVPPDKWNQFYVDALKNLPPGVTEFVIHLAYDNDEMHAATRERDTWGAAWRQRDFDFFTSAEFRHILQEQSIKAITWRELVHPAQNTR
jgi:predicted glycoside hydrolase/deacetylase ChbG (UPF0249 family)